jgi:DNA-binding transcriptional regulator YhcF (GntR family)
MAPELALAVDRNAGVPVGAQLAALIRAALRDGALVPGDRLPSVRELAEAAGVNVNTARSVYARLEAEGVVRSEQGRGTFVSGTSGNDAATRRELRRQIAQLEGALARLPPAPALADDRSVSRRAGPTLLSTRDLEAVRDELLTQLGVLDAQREAVRRRLEQLGVEEAVPEASPRRGTPSLAGARIRWIGA